jgi:pimeloyl-ACP methyl ester carboxylesterase
MAGEWSAPRPIGEVREILLGRAKERRNPFIYLGYDEAAPVINGLRSVDSEEWAGAFSALAEPHEERAAAAEAAGDASTAREQYLLAYDCFHVARFPAPNTPERVAAYRKAQRAFLKAARYFDPPLDRVEMPFQGRAGEGRISVGYLRKPKGIDRPPVVVVFGGIDAFKEERPADPHLKVGHATLSIDMPGVGDAPLAGSVDAERLWDAVFDYIAGRPDLDPDRVGVYGGSTGGYWASKLAHTHRHRLRAAVNHGGMTHFALSEAWIMKAQRGEYPFEFAETLASAFGRSTAEEWIEIAPSLSLLDQGVLDQPSAPLLLVNGIHDTVFPIADMHLLLEHGSPKSARFFDAGHMGGPGAPPVITEWLTTQLSR